MARDGDETSAMRDSVRGGDAPAPKRDGQLAGIGLAGGAFSGLFGVGGGVVIVPLLVLWRGLAEKRATGTSLVAIVVIAIFGVFGNARFGAVDIGKGLMIGVPAILGAVFGTALQQRLSDRLLAGLFAILAVSVVILYLVTNA